MYTWWCSLKVLFLSTAVQPVGLGYHCLYIKGLWGVWQLTCWKRIDVRCTERGCGVAFPTAKLDFFYSRPGLPLTIWLTIIFPFYVCVLIKWCAKLTDKNKEKTNEFSPVFYGWIESILAVVWLRSHCAHTLNWILSSICSILYFTDSMTWCSLTNNSQYIALAGQRSTEIQALKKTVNIYWGEFEKP